MFIVICVVNHWSPFLLKISSLRERILFILFIANIPSIKTAWYIVKFQSVIVNVVQNQFDVQIIIASSQVHIVYWKTQI